jgi:hypothetical protein
MSLGSFFGGLTSGLEAGQQMRASRQLEKIRDAGIRQLENNETDTARGFKRLGYDPESLMSDYETPDPIWARLAKWKKSRGRPRRALSRSLPLSADMTPMEPQMESITVDEYAMPEFADGGRVDTKWVNRDMKNFSRELPLDAKIAKAVDKTKALADSGVERVREAAKYKGVGGIGEGGKFVRALKGAGAAGALGATAMDVADTPTEDYRERFGLQTNDPSLMGDIGVRALGAASDLGNNAVRALTLGNYSLPYRDKQRKALQQDPALASDNEALPARGPSTRPRGSSTRNAPSAVTMDEVTVVAQRGGPARSPKALPSSAEPVDLSDVSPEEIPDFRVQDWEEYRREMAVSMLLRGKSTAEVMQTVDSAVIQMQQQGFTNYAQQAMAMLQGGNLKGAAAALRAAYQYLPTGKDAKFGVKNNKLYALTIDEATGKPVGSPFEVQPELIYAITDNMRKEGMWQQYAKDRRDFQMDLRKYEEVEKPLAEANASAALTNARANATRAQTDMMQAEAALAGGRDDGLKASDYDRAGNYFVTKAEEFSFENGLDAAAAERLAAVMSEVYRRNPSMDPRVIVQRVLESARSR